MSRCAWNVLICPPCKNTFCTSCVEKEKEEEEDVYEWSNDLSDDLTSRPHHAHDWFRELTRKECRMLFSCFLKPRKTALMWPREEEEGDLLFLPKCRLVFLRPVNSGDTHTQKKKENRTKTWKARKSLNASGLMGVLSGSPGGRVHVGEREIDAAFAQVSPRLHEPERGRPFSKPPRLRARTPALLSFFFSSSFFWKSHLSRSWRGSRLLSYGKHAPHLEPWGSRWRWRMDGWITKGSRFHLDPRLISLHAFKVFGSERTGEKNMRLFTEFSHILK